MGVYINPPDMMKEDWLEQHGTELPASPESYRTEDNRYVVCLVRNSAFSAAGIAVDQLELEAFKRPDNRLKRWFLVDHNKLAKVAAGFEQELARIEQRKATSNINGTAAG